LVAMGLAFLASWIAVVRIPASTLQVGGKDEEENDRPGDVGPEGVRAA